MSNPTQLYLLADHIKLSLLERKRAISLNLEPNAQDSNISRSLESMREGVEALEQEAERLQGQNDGAAASTSNDAQTLRAQYSDLQSQFHGFPSNTGASTLEHPNDPALEPDFAHATSKPSSQPPSKASAAANKSVRFRDASPSARADEEDAANRAALFPYRDDPEQGSAAVEAARSGAGATDDLSNQQIHAYHDRVLAEQDEQLDRLGESIGRQRELSERVGAELDEHVGMLDELDGHVDRHQGRLDGARERVGRIARRANDNKQLTVIAILIVILVLLIIILKT